MTAPTQSPPRPPARRNDPVAAARQRQFIAIAGIALMAGAVATGAPTVGRALIGGLGLLVFLLITRLSRVAAVCLIIVWLVLLGFVRRLLVPFVGWAEIDPLLAVNPATAITLWYTATRARRSLGRRELTVIGGICGFMFLWVLAQILNPNESSVFVALQAATFYLTPLMWFFVGRLLEPEEHDAILTSVMWVGIPVVALGMYHSLVDFLPFEYTWIGVSGQSAAIFLPGFRIRPFSTLVSPQEYGFFLGFLILLLWARILHRQGRLTFLLPYFAISVVALFLQASRTIFILCMFALMVTGVVRSRSAVALIGAAFVATLLVSLTLNASFEKTGADADNPGSVATGFDEEPGKTGVLVEHQLSGLTNPEDSTASLHFDLIGETLDVALDNPFGVGVSFGTIAAKKQDAKLGFGGEMDLPNVTAGMGFPAGIALILLIVCGLATAYRLQVLDPSAKHLTWLGFLLTDLTQWWNGSLYAVSAILFVSLGGITAEAARRRAGTASRPGGDGGRTRRRDLADAGTVAA